MVYPTTHNDLAASEVGPLSNWDRPYMENEGWGGEGRIYNIENDIGIIILRFYTARRDPPSGITAPRDSLSQRPRSSWQKKILPSHPIMERSARPKMGRF